MGPVSVLFAAGEAGEWRIESIRTIAGEGLAMAERLAVIESHAPAPAGSLWSLRGTTSNMRYTSRQESTSLTSRQSGLGRAEARSAALIPITKKPAWWRLAQDERRAILEEQSRHIAIGLGYLPAIARRLLHGRDLGEPFDFLTWFEFAPDHAGDFDNLLAELRASEEWRYVEREVDIRLSLAG